MISYNEDVNRKALIEEVINENEIINLAYRALELIETIGWDIPKACEQVAGEYICSFSLFLPNYEDYAFLYFIKLSEILEEKVKEIKEKEN
ncbi:MAG: hypothetical protein DRP06_04280 [Candidatus Aenigmatarchaeota archaeon]|nr:MAG: hypothetical protein DRP06_04280 [Candidatus Aenigmarchaeota archaeon]